MDELKRRGVVVAVVGALCAFGLVLIVAIDVVGSMATETGGSPWMARRVAIGFYVVAIGMLALAGWKIGRGQGFVDVMPRLLSWSGMLLVLGSVYDMFGAAMVLRILDAASFRSVAFFDASYVTVGAVGLLLWLLGGLMKRAVAMARELEDFI